MVRDDMRLNYLQNPKAMPVGQALAEKRFDPDPAGPVGVSPSAAEKTNPTKPKMVYVAAAGHGGGCGHCTGMANWVPEDKAKQAKEARNRKNYDEVAQHEAAHRSRARHLARGGSIRQNPETGETQGEEQVDIPKVPKITPPTPDQLLASTGKSSQEALLDQTIADAGIVMDAALAPDKPSAQDRVVFGQGAAVKGEATAAKQMLKNNPTSQNKPLNALA